jgi:AcrR family transcriptional regulator
MSSTENGVARGTVAPRASSAAGMGDGKGRQGAHVIEMQRRRLLTAVVELACEGGVQSLSVATLCERAGLSRRTFYDLFDDREDCLHAAFEDAADTAKQTVIRAGGAHKRWRERVRAGLAALLSLFDHEPGLGRLLVVEALGCGPPTLEVRRRALMQAAAVVDEGRTEARSGREPPPLTAEGIVGADFAVVHARLLERDPRPLRELTGSLMA